MSDLNNTTVLVTRPRHQADNLAALIAQHGGTALRFATLEIGGTPDEAQVRDAIGDIRDYDIAIFISINAVANGAAFVPEDQPRPLIAAIGPSTARALSDAGIACDIRASHGFTSEALLLEPVFADMTGKRVVIFRGTGGRAHLGAELQRRGADVTYAEVYTRDRPAELDDDIAKRLADGEIDIVTATSAETLVNLYELAEGATLEGLLNTQLVTASDRVVKKATALGFVSTALVATGPDDQAIVDALIQWRRQTPTEETMTNQVSRPQDDDAPTANADVPDSRDVVVPRVSKTGPDDTVTDEPSPRNDRASSGRSGSLPGLLAMLLSVAALIGVGWLWWQHQQQQLQAADSLSASASEVEQLQQQLVALDGRLDDSISRTSQLLGSSGRIEGQVDDVRDSLETLTARVQGVEKSIDDVRGVSAAARDNWVRAEVEYFLQAANSRLQLARDPDSALAALMAADDRLQSLGDPSLFRVRQQIATEIEALRAIPRPDVEGIAHTLNGLARRVEALPLNNSAPEPFASGDPQVEGETALAKAKSAVLGAFSDMISVKRTDAAATPLLSRDEEFFLRRNLELQLQTARLALLRGDAGNYRESLRTSRAWIQTHFDATDAAAEGAIRTLTQLEAVDIAPQLPDVSGSLRLLRLSSTGEPA